MGKQILNRREAIYAEEIPPEIADTSGFIEATDYATDTTGGTVKVDDAYGVELTQAGKLRGTVETAAAYGEASNNLLVSKGTLDNVLAAQPAGGFTFDLLLEKTTSTAQGAEVELLHDYTDYKVLFIEIGDGGNNNTQHGCLIVDAMSKNTVGTNLFYGSTLNGVRVVKSGDTVVPNKLCFYFSGSIAQIRIYGVK